MGADGGQAIDGAALKRIAQVNGRLRNEGRDPKALFSLNFAFHFDIYKAAEMPTLLGLIENLWLRIGPLLHYTATDYDAVAVASKHDLIIGALKNRDPALAVRILGEDLTEAAEIISPHLIL